MPGPAAPPSRRVVGRARRGSLLWDDGFGRAVRGWVMATWISASGGVLGAVQQLGGFGLGTLLHSKDHGRNWGRVVAVARRWKSPKGDEGVVSSRIAFCSKLVRIVPIWLGSFDSDLWESCAARWLEVVGSEAVAGVGTSWEVLTGSRRGCYSLCGGAGFANNWAWA